jgi:uncharacterized protein YbjT (DUF2867 family)
MQDIMHIVVTGGTGYIGGRLIPRLLDAGHRVSCITREPAQLQAHFGDRIDIVRGDIFDADALANVCEGADALYYLIHSMSQRSEDFAATDRKAAAVVGKAAAAAGIKRIIYLGGLGDRSSSLSRHLRSRHEVGDILRESGVPVTELRAAVIIGAGSASFEMMRNITERLPVMVAPRWVNTRCQPLWINDVLSYLVESLERPETEGNIYDIGGSEILTYRDMMTRYAAARGIRRAILVVPILSPRLSSYWVHFVTPLPTSLASALIESLTNEVIVHDRAAEEAFSVRPIGYDEAVSKALDRQAQEGPETTWFDAVDVQRLPGEFAGEKEGMLIDRRQRRCVAPQEAIAEIFTSLGGDRGWLYADSLWKLRGWMDSIVGGFGTRRGRRSAHSLRIGDAVDFWRVEAYEPGRSLRLRAEMRLPGAAWLQFEALDEDGVKSLRQTAFFEPQGLLGHCYWFSVMPFHSLIFGNMATRIVEEAEASVTKEVQT